MLCFLRTKTTEPRVTKSGSHNNLEEPSYRIDFVSKRAKFNAMWLKMECVSIPI